MRLVPNWRAVLRKAWSFRLLALAAILTGAEYVFPLLDLPALTHGQYLALMGPLTAAGMVARMVAQESLHEHPEPVQGRP